MCEHSWLDVYKEPLIRLSDFKRTYKTHIKCLQCNTDLRLSQFKEKGEGVN